MSKAKTKLYVSQTDEIPCLSLCSRDGKPWTCDISQPTQAALQYAGIHLAIVGKKARTLEVCAKASPPPSNENRGSRYCRLMDYMFHPRGRMASIGTVDISLKISGRNMEITANDGKVTRSGNTCQLIEMLADVLSQAELDRQEV